MKYLSCYLPSCSAPRRKGQLLCRGHWSQLSDKVKGYVRASARGMRLKQEGARRCYVAALRMVRKELEPK